MEFGLVESAVFTDVLEEFAVSGAFLPGWVEAQGEVGAEEDFFVSDEVGYAAEDCGLVEEGAGGAVVVDVAEAFTKLGVGLKEGEATAPVGEDEVEFGGGLGEADEFLQGGGWRAAGMGVPGGLGDMEVDRPMVFGAPVGEGTPGGALGVEVLHADVELADTAEAEGEGVFELAAGVGVGEDGGEAGEAVGCLGDPAGDGLVVPAAGVLVLPVPAEEDCALHALCVHRGEHVLGAGPVLDAGPGVGGDEVGPVGFAVCFGPCAGVFPQFCREGVGVGVDYVVGWHKLMTGVCRVAACGLERSCQTLKAGHAGTC